ncbi:MAG: ferrous iron transport protein B [Thermoanaerobaculia bacterium]
MTKNKKIFGIIGIPNSGKTTFFNSLTGLHQHTGNWPGVTVEKKVGIMERDGLEVELVDLPGILSLSANSLDEKISRDFLLKGEADGFVLIVDALNLERGLYLISQLQELEIPLILVLNKIDKAREAEFSIDIKGLEALLNIPVFPCVATREEGIEEIKRAIFSGKFKILKKKTNYGEDFEKIIYKVEKFLEENFKGIEKGRFFALKLLEEDKEFSEKLKMEEKYPQLKELIEKEAFLFCSRFHYKDLAEFISEKRYGFASGILNEVLKDYSLKSKIHFSNQIDLVLTHKLFGIPFFIAVLYLLFSLVFYIGNPAGNFIKKIFEISGKNLETFFLSLSFPKILSSLIVNGILNGVGTVIQFLPNIFLLFFFISLLEDSGYFTRISFLFDKFMHLIGLHGKAILPMILGFGCNVPAIMGTRILEEERDRILTILIIPFLSCSARLPIYVLFAGIFFPEREGLVILSLYLFGMLLSFISARFFQKFLIKKPLSPMIMELPPYHIPSFKGALLHSWIRAKLFLKKASTVILAGVLVIWFLSSFPSGVEYGSKDSFAGKIGELISPLLKPLGFGFYQAALALLFGIVAKEVVVGTFGVLFSPNPLKEILPNYFTPLSAFSFMLISLIYIPCISTIAMIKREAGLKYALILILYTLALGWLISFIFYQTGLLFFKIAH